MARPPSGQVIERSGVRGVTFGLRFRAYGKREYVTASAVTRAEAELELQNILADVRRGIWQPAARAVVEALAETPTFWQYASNWLEGKKREGLAEKTIEDYSWALSNHLLGFFADYLLTDITPAAVKGYARAKATEGVLSNNSINKTIGRLSQVLADAVDEGLIATNPAEGRRRRLKGTKPVRTHLDRAEQLAALLDAAGELDSEARDDRRHIARRPLVAVLMLAGLRLSECVGLRWRDVDLANGRLRVDGSKTDAARRAVPLLPVLRDELAAWRAAAPRTEPLDFVFATASGRKLGVENARSRVFNKAVKRANANMERAELAPLPSKLTPHSMRRTYASVRVALGHDPVTIARDIGHEDAASMTLRVYAQVMADDEGAREQLRAFVNGADWAQMGTNRLENTESVAGLGNALAVHPA